MFIDQRKAFTELFVRSQHRVYGYVVTLFPDRNDADEVFQETCLVLWSKWHEFDTSRDFVRWACGIAHNVARNYRRSRQRTSVGISETLLEEVAAIRLEEEPQLEQRKLALAECLQKLPPEKRDMLERSYLRGEGMGQVAQHLGISTTRLYLRLQRVRRVLFECVERIVHGGAAS